MGWINEILASIGFFLISVFGGSHAHPFDTLPTASHQIVSTTASATSEMKSGKGLATAGARAIATVDISGPGIVGARRYAYVANQDKVTVSVETEDGTDSYVVTGADATTFTEVKPGPYMKDKYHVYFEKAAIPDADPATFTSFSTYIGLDGYVLVGAEGYGKDVAHVYYGNTAIAADPATFSAVDGIFGVDPNHVFGFGVLLKGIQRASFADLGQGCPGFGELIKDTNGVYEVAYDENDVVQTYHLPNLDAKTFAAAPDGSSFRDKNGTYTPDQICKNL